MQIVATPPSTTAGTAPINAAAMPDSNAPSSFEPLMKTISTAFTRPRSSSGVASATVIDRMFMLNMSAKPATASAAQESGNDFESPKTIIASAEDRHDKEQRPAGVAADRPSREDDAGNESSDRRRAAEDAEPDRPGVEDVLCEEGQEGHCAAEEHGEEVERDRTEEDRCAPDEARAREERLPAGSGLQQPFLRTLGHRQDTDERDDEQRGGDDVDELRPRRKEQPADGRPDDRRALERDSAQCHGARERSVETSVGGIERAAGQPSAAAEPAASASARNGHNELAPASVTTSSPPAIRPSSTIAVAKTSRRGNRSAMWPAGKARSGKGRNSARPIRPRSSGFS